MSFNKLHVSQKSTKLFPLLKGRTGLHPNILCRMALCLSISEPSVPDAKLDDEKGMEFNRYTLLGEWDAFFISLLKERLIHDGLDPEKNLMPQFKAHLNRGIMMLFSRVKDISDIYDLIPTVQKTGSESTLKVDHDINHSTVNPRKNKRNKGNLRGRVY